MDDGIKEIEQLLVPTCRFVVDLRLRMDCRRFTFALKSLKLCTNDTSFNFTRFNDDLRSVKNPRDFRVGAICSINPISIYFGFQEFPFRFLAFALTFKFTMFKQTTVETITYVCIRELSFVRCSSHMARQYVCKPTYVRFTRWRQADSVATEGISNHRPNCTNDIK